MIEISIILPCLNEEKALGFCLDKIKDVIKQYNLKAEIIVVDNGSVDNSCRIALEKGVNLVREERRGYGYAYLKGFEVARGKDLFLADSDGTYDFNEIPRFIEQLKKGYDFVIGDRLSSKIGKKAMPWAHKYIGNPMLSGVLRKLFKVSIHDAHCGMRAITKKALKELKLKTGGMELASEMVIMAGKKGLKIKELHIDYFKRRGDSKLNSLSDGWRHLRFMLLYSPLYLFFFPGLVILLFGLAIMSFLYFNLPIMWWVKIYYHNMFAAALLIIVGYQLIIFSLFAKTYAITHLGDEPIFDKLYKYVTIERVSVIGILLVLLGIIIYFRAGFGWARDGFNNIDQVKNSIMALTLIIVGVQTISSSFMLSILGIKEK